MNFTDCSHCASGDFLYKKPILKPKRQTNRVLSLRLRDKILGDCLKTPPILKQIKQTKEFKAKKPQNSIFRNKLISGM